MREITLFVTESNKKLALAEVILRIQIGFSVGIPDQDPLLLVQHILSRSDFQKEIRIRTSEKQMRSVGRSNLCGPILFMGSQPWIPFNIKISLVDTLPNLKSF